MSPRTRRVIVWATALIILSLLAGAWQVERSKAALNKELVSGLHSGGAAAVERAILRGADPDTREDGVYSLAEDDPASVSLIEKLRRAAGFEPRNLGPTALIQAVEFGDIETVEVLIRHRANANARDALGPVLRHARLQFEMEATASSRSILDSLRSAGARE
jgi:hypothetical protein